MTTVSFAKVTRSCPGADRPAVDALHLDIAMVFQNYALHPHMSVADNTGFALKVAGTPKGEIGRRVQEAARILDLEPYLQRRPKALSGGLEEVRMADDGVQLGGSHLPLPRRVRAAVAAEGGDRVVLGFRPEALETVAPDERGLGMTVTMVEVLGSEAYAHGTLQDDDGRGGGDSVLAGPGTGADVVARVDPRTPPRKGERITLRLRPDSAYFFSAATGERLPHA
ncbi:ATP-binding cassette domain-containing protein [Streptomyces lydicus]|uniref:hypothetical protein n=1 Tax=Streptomyces lydicus TaxID=47763 RepID=UPI000981745A|nr:hypothetical protein [Streptomyces lydicus]